MTERVQWVFRARSKNVDRQRLVAEVERACAPIDARLMPRLKLTATIEKPPRWNVIPFSSRPMALVSIGTPDRVALAEAARAARLTELETAAFESFEVTTSVPVPVPVDAKIGEPTPGVELLTLFRRRPGLDDKTFIQRWHGVHTPLSLEIHPLWGYIRNVVDARWPSDATPLDGIVEEYFERPQDLLNPVSFFNGPLMMVPNMARVALDIRRFIDLATIETYWVTERWLRVG